MGTLHIVAEGEEGIRTQRHLCVLCNPCFLFLTGKHLGLFLEELLPFAFCQHIIMVVRDIDVDGVVTVSPADPVDERQRHHLRMLAEPPDISLVTSQTGTVDTTLLTGTNTDGLSVFDIADRVTLCIFQGDECNDQVALGISREYLVLSGDVLEQSGIIQLDLITSLFEGNAKHLLAFHGFRHIVGVDLNHIIGSLALLAENLQSLFSITGGNHTVGNLTLQQRGGNRVTGIRQSNEVTIGAHTVGTTGTSIGTSNSRLVQSFDVINEIDLLQRVAQGESYGSTSR